VTARNILGGSPPGYELNEKKIFTREERFNKIYVPVEHPEGYTNACKWGVIFRTPPCKRGDIVAIFHLVGPLEYWNMVYGIRESNPPDLKNSETYLGSIWKDCILPPVSQYGNPNWFPLPLDVSTSMEKL